MFLVIHESLHIASPGVGRIDLGKTVRKTIGSGPFGRLCGGLPRRRK